MFVEARTSVRLLKCPAREHGMQNTPSEKAGLGERKPTGEGSKLHGKSRTPKSWRGKYGLYKSYCWSYLCYSALGTSPCAPARDSGVGWLLERSAAFACVLQLMLTFVLLCKKLVTPRRATAQPKCAWLLCFKPEMIFVKTKSLPLMAF